MEELGIKIEPTGDATNSGLLAKKPLEESDYYTRFQELKKQIEFYDVQEEYIKDEMRNLRKEYLHAQEEVKHSMELQYGLLSLGETYSIDSACYRPVSRGY